MTRERASLSYAGHLLRKECEIWVACDPEVVGHVSFGPARDADAPAGSAEIWALYVRPDRQRRGIGTALLAKALEEIGEADAYLWVLEDNQVGRAFYEKHGWTHDGGRKLVALDDQELPVVRYARGR
jgi:ribosomal protein S18 acetylase RimI-like enzyme